MISGVARSSTSFRGGAFGLVALVVLLATLWSAGVAFADQTREYTGVSFGPDGVGGAETFSDVQSLAVDPSSEDVYAYDAGAEKVYKFDAEGRPVDFSALADNVIEAVGGFIEPGGRQIAVAPPRSPGGTAGDIYVANNLSVKVYSPAGLELGAFGEGETCGVGVDPVGHVFVGSYPSAIREYVPASNPPTNADKTGEGKAAIELCGIAADGAGDIFATSFRGERLARLEGIGDAEPTIIEPAGATIATDPATGDLYVDRGDHVVALGPSGGAGYEFASDQIGGSYGIAVGPAGESIYVSDGETGTIKVFGALLTPPTTEPAAAVTTDAATLSGVVYPEGRQLSDCRFEYGLSAAAGFESAGDCEPDASQIPVDSQPHAVSLSLADLRPNSDYKFRLVATSSAGPARGQTLTFSTVGPPRVTEVISRADHGSASLDATVDPRGAATSYRIEWGSTDSYGTVAVAGAVSPGDGPTEVSAHLPDLTPATTYHYRVVAESTEGGETVTPDQRVETLNSCGLTDGRCFELVSRADKGPLASPGKIFLFGGQIQFQAATAGSAFAFTVYSGYPEATAGNAALYLARRSGGGWSSEQLTPPNNVNPARTGNGGSFEALSSDLGCGVVSSRATLVLGAPPTVVEAGGGNLYRRDDADGSYRLITHLPPVDSLVEPAYLVVGMSPDCRRVIFRTPYRYPGISTAGEGSKLYEWAGGMMRNVAVIPGPDGGAVPAEALPGAMDEAPNNGAPLGEKRPTDYRRAVSADASRTVFTAISNVGDDSGSRAIFLRDAEDPGVLSGSIPATDVSRSETAVPNDGNSRYWTASADAKLVFFTARYGLAANGTSSGAVVCANAPAGGVPEGSGEGCDLYEHDADAPAGERLTDLSADSDDPRGAGVVGVLDASEDGGYVYFAARGRLGGAGRTEAENRKASTYNVYLAHAGEIRFVGLLGQEEALDGNVLVDTSPTGDWTSQATADGKSLVFESSAGVAGGVSMVYLYAGGATVCVSCRHDGRPPFSERHLLTALVGAQETDPHGRAARPTILTGNGRLYFYSFDALAPGGVEGDRNLYQWEHGQVSLIATEPPGGPRQGDGAPTESFFGGADGDGGDVYFATPQALVGADQDGRWDVYDARIGGGFPEPTPPTPPCDSAAEGACNSAEAIPPATAGVATSAFAGPGNPKGWRPACGKARRAVKKHGKWRCVKRHQHKRNKHHHKKSKHHRRAKK